MGKLAPGPAALSSNSSVDVDVPPACPDALDQSKRAAVAAATRSSSHRPSSSTCGPAPADTLDATIRAFLAAAGEQLQACGDSSSSSSLDAQLEASITFQAVAAASQLLQRVASGASTLEQVEQQLLSHLGGDCSNVGSLAQQQQQQQQLGLLLAGALMHGLLSSEWQREAVWACGAAGAQQQEEGAAAVAVCGPVVPSHLLQLPGVLVKAVRGDVPLWLLAQLRRWMQAATLGLVGQ
jgi:hypothetical protein